MFSSLITLEFRSRLFRMRLFILNYVTFSCHPCSNFQIRTGINWVQSCCKVFFINGALTLEFFDYFSLQIHDCVLQEQPFQNHFLHKNKMKLACFVRMLLKLKLNPQNFIGQRVKCRFYQKYVEIGKTLCIFDLKRLFQTTLSQILPIEHFPK